jgi:polycomb protein EED
MKVSPVHPYIIATAANDHTIRIWSLDPKRRSQPTIAICGGEGGHREGILTMVLTFSAETNAPQAFHANPLYILSGGMDHAVCLWLCPILHNLHLRSSAVPAPDPATIDVPERYSYPHVSTTAIHTDYVDCVDFHNDFILSKSSRENRIVLWHILGFDSQRKYENRESMIPPTTTHEYKETLSAFGDSVVRLMQFDIRTCDPWFMKFGVFSYPLDLLSRVNDKDRGSSSQDGKVEPSTFLAMGNAVGNVYVWDLGVFEQVPAKGDPPGKSLSNAFALMKPHYTLGVPKLKRLIRQVAWSTYGDWLVAVGDAGLVCLWQVGSKQSD